MKILNKIKFFVLFFTTFLFCTFQVHSKDKKILDSYNEISNYFLGIIATNDNNTNEALSYFKKVDFLRNSHRNFNLKFIRVLVDLDKFNEAFSFLKELPKNKKDFFEANLLLGLEAFTKQDFLTAEQYFKKLNWSSKESFFLEDIFNNVLISWVKASQNNQKEAFKYINQIPNRYENLKKIQKTLMLCHFESPDAIQSFQNLIHTGDYNFSRYSFFLASHLLRLQEINEAKKVINKVSAIHDSNLLLRQSNIYLQKSQYNKLKEFFDCNNSSHAMSEFFYLIANLYSTQEDFVYSNFYLKISNFLNKKFSTNKLLMAENYISLKDYNKSKKIYFSSKKIGEVYSWYVDKKLAIIISIEDDNHKAINFLKKSFNKLNNPQVRHYRDLANFYKDSGHYEESIKYYSVILDKLHKEDSLVPNILHKRGTSYERLGLWEKAEKDLTLSLKISPDQPYVLNYLAYSWLDKKINIDQALHMLKKANMLEEEDPYILDSLGWAMYLTSNYDEAKKLLQEAIQLMPLDPILNDHYGDILWKLNKKIQARYFWKYAFNLKNTDEKLKKIINRKLIFGLIENS